MGRLRLVEDPYSRHADPSYLRGIFRYGGEALGWEDAGSNSFKMWTTNLVNSNLGFRGVTRGIDDLVSESNYYSLRTKQS